MKFCCGMTENGKEHQLWCSEHPARQKEKAPVNTETVKPPSNSEQAFPDEVAVAIAKSFEARPDRWATDGESAWCFDDHMRISIAGGANGVVVYLLHSGKHYEKVMSTAASQDAIWAAYKAWQAKRMIAHTERPDEPPPPPLTWKDWLSDGVKTFWFLGPAGAAAAMAVAFLITTLGAIGAQDEARKAIALANEQAARLSDTDTQAQFADLVARLKSARADDWFERLPQLDISKCGNDDACYRQFAERAARSEGRLIRGSSQ